MATSGSAAGTFSGRPRFQAQLDVTRSGVSGNSSKYDFTLRVFNLDGVNYTYDLGSYPWYMDVEGTYREGYWTPDFRGGQGNILIVSGTTPYIPHNSSGNLTVNFSFNMPNTGLFGTAAASGSFASNQLNTDTVPGTPPAVTIKATTPVEVQYTGSSPSNGGSTLLESQHEITISGTGWDNPVATKKYPFPSGVSYFNFTGLVPSTKYAVHVRYRNAIGWGAWSPTVYATTLPSGPPLVAVSASADGTQATIKLTPPSGSTGVTKYTLERRVQGTTPVTTVSLTGTDYVQKGLTPGTTYEWRASATFGSYVSPYSAWLAVRQPNPNTNPGDYFDGSTVPEAGSDVTYAWTGAVNNSTSQALGHNTTGWNSFTQAAVGTGATGVQIRQSGGVYGAHAARYMFWTDQTVAGFAPGMVVTSAAAVVSEVDVVGSISIIPPRAQLVAARVQFVNAANAVLSTIVGTPRVAPADVPTRLSVHSANSPAGTVGVVVTAIDVAGTGHVMYQAGDAVVVDAASIFIGGVEYPYFDGSFPDGNGYTYDWTGTPDASTSERNSVTQVIDDPLLDPDCPPVPKPPRPPVILDECIEDVSSWRRYWYDIPASEVSDWQTELLTLSLTSGSIPIRQVRIRLYPNPFQWASETIEPNSYCAEQIVSYVPPSTTLTIDGVTQRVWAEVQGSAAIAADHLLYGTGGVPATWPELSCGINYAISVDVPVDAPAGNILARDISLTRRL